MSELHDPAKERLLDASLAEVFGRTAPSKAVHEAPPAQPQRAWLIAALLALGIGVVVASLFWQEQGGSAVAQDPQPKPLPEATVLTNEGDVANLPDDVENLVLMLPSLERLGALVRLTKLRGLCLVEQRQGERPRVINHALDVLEPLTKLPALEELRLPANLQLQRQQIASLVKMPKLRSLTISGAFTFDARQARQLATSPQLRELTFDGLHVEPGALSALEPLGLTSLRLAACLRASSRTYGEIDELRTLRKLGITHCLGFSKERPEISPLAFGMMSLLPDLAELDLEESNFPDRCIEMLPRRLRKLNLGGREMNQLSIAGLARLGELEDLDFNQGAFRKDAVELIRKLKLKRLRLRGWSDQSVVDTIAQHPTLERVKLRLKGRIELARLHEAPRLRHVTLLAEDGTLVPGLPDALASLRAKKIVVEWNEPNRPR